MDPIPIERLSGQNIAAWCLYKFGVKAWLNWLKFVLPFQLETAVIIYNKPLPSLPYFSHLTLHIYYFLWPCSPGRAMASSFTRFRDHTQDAPQSVGLLWTSDQLVAETSTWQHTTDKHPCPRWDRNPRSWQASGRRPMPYTVRPLGPALTFI
jgi:hypothetical protein